MSWLGMFVLAGAAEHSCDHLTRLGLSGVSAPAGGTLPVIACVHPCSHSKYPLERGMELTQRITSRMAELTGEVELPRKQLAD